MSNVRKYIKDRNKDKNDGKKPVVVEEFDDRIKKHRTKTRIILFGIIALILIIFTGIKIYFDQKKYTGYEELSSTNTDTGADQYIAFGDYVLRYNNDGITYLGADNKAVWSQSFEMKTPVIDICKDFVAIGNQKSNEIYVCSKSKIEGKITTAYPIISLDVASQGVVAAILEDGNINYVDLYDKKGNELVSDKSVLEGNGYPMDISLSEDGTKLVVSYLNVKGDTFQNSVVFYNFSEVGKNEVDRMVGGFNQYNTAVVPKVEFINNNVVCAFADDRFTLYSMKQKPEKICEVKLDQKIKSVFNSSKYIGFVLKNEDSGKEKTLKVYNLKGKEVLSRTITDDYTNIQFADNRILLYNELSCKLITLSGRIKFQYSFNKGITDMIPTSKTNRYLLIGADSIDEIRLKY